MGRRAAHLAVVVEELPPARPIVMPHFDPRVVDDRQAALAKVVGKQHVLTERLIRKRYAPDRVSTVRAVAAHQKIPVAPGWPVR